MKMLSRNGKREMEGTCLSAAWEALDAASQVNLATQEPVWVRDKDQFAILQGDACYLFDPETLKRRLAFRRSRINRSMNSFLRHKNTSGPFELDRFEFWQKGEVLKVVFKGTQYFINLNDYKVFKSRRIPRVEGDSIRSLSPDGKTIAYISDYNIYVCPSKGGQATQLTRDGTKDRAYLGMDDTRCLQFIGPPADRGQRQSFLWSPDSRRLAVYRLDQQKVQKAYLLDQSRSPSRVIALRYAYPGASRVFSVRLFVIDIHTGKIVPTKANRKDHHLLYYLSWDPTGKEVYYIGVDRSHKKMDLMAFDPNARETRVLVSERYETHIEDNGMLFQQLPDGERFLWASERNGWNHIYLYDKAGNCLAQVTRGELAVSQIVGFNEENETLYFLAAQDEVDPYYQHLFKVHITGHNQEKLTTQHATHKAFASPSSRFFIIQYSAPDIPHRMDLIDSSGRSLRRLARSDIRSWLKAGWKFPEAFTVLAADGKISLHGLMYKPRDFNPSKKYPLVEYVYPGPIKYITPKVFIPNDQNQALSELGFIVVVLDGRGTFGRGKAFQDFSYGRFGQYELVDHVAAIEQLGKRYSFIDSTRVGIYGRSAGGYAAARALVQYPQVYKVGVAISGHHDYRRYIWYWVEQYCGDPKNKKACYADQANARHARNLTGKLLLIHGTLDDNVLPEQTMNLADALIREKKNVDICLIPGQGHEYEGVYGEYCTLKIWEYFTEHLLRNPPVGNHSGSTADP